MLKISQNGLKFLNVKISIFWGYLVGKDIQKYQIYLEEMKV